jgi:hypothetical protein
VPLLPLSFQQGRAIRYIFCFASYTKGCRFYPSRTIANGDN